MTDKSAVHGEPVSDRELSTSRLLDAPREPVFNAFADPVRLARWWGPEGFTNTFHEFTLLPGGKWRFVMHGPDGTNYPNESVFIEILRGERIVFNHVSLPRFQMTITFEEYGGKTRVGWHQLFATPEECRRVAKFAVEANEQNLDRLEQEVARG
jgi:uncharacterized protein YndB with AHSA1/START domain